MNNINRTIIGLAFALLTLSMVLPTLTTASADIYDSDGSNGAGQAAGYVVGGVAVAGTVLYLLGAKKSHSDSTMTSGQ